MSGGFVKIYGTILDSSIWSQDLATRVLWITMLTMADRVGSVSASVDGLARRANLTRAECEAGLAKLVGPDPDSKSKAFQGRRIRAVDGGWKILNYEKYRELRTESQVQEAERKAKWRKSGSDKGDEAGHVPPVPAKSADNHAEGEAEAEAGTDLKTKTAAPAPRPLRRAARGTATVSTLVAGELVQQILGLKATHPGGASSYIPRSGVTALGADVLRAYTALGGQQRFLAATGKDLAFLNNDFAKALTDARREGVSA